MASPIQERTVGGAYGTPPYAESSFRSALRMLASGLGGVSVPQGANFGEAFLSSLAGSSKAATAAGQAAQAYAEKRQQADEARQHQVVYEDYLKQLTAKSAADAAKVPPPPKPVKKEPWEMTPEEFKVYLDRERQLAIARAAGKPAKEAAVPKLPEDVRKRVDEINGLDVNNPDDRYLLQKIVANPKTPEEAKAAQDKMTISPGFFRYSPKSYKPKGQ